MGFGGAVEPVPKEGPRLTLLVRNKGDYSL